EERAAAGDAAAGELGGGGLVFDEQGDVLHAAAEARGDAGPGGGDESVEIGRTHGRSSILGDRGSGRMPAGSRHGRPMAGATAVFCLLATSTPKRVVVAIDGPAGAGKSTIAKRLAERLQFIYIDTGAMYRAVALWALRQSVAWDDMHRMEQLAIAAEIELAPGRISLNGEDVTEAIRTPEVSNGASKIAVIPGVRRAMVAKQREMGERASVVMEGRDIGTVVF